MSRLSCPHCGTRLPAVVDAFCPECRNDLDEAPAPEQPAFTRPARRGIVGNAFEAWHWVQLGAVLIGLVLLAVAELMDGKPTLAFVVGAAVAGVTLFVFLRWATRASPSLTQDDRPREHSLSVHDEPGEASS